MLFGLLAERAPDAMAREQLTAEDLSAVDRGEGERAESEVEPTTDCAFGLLFFCLVEVPRVPDRPKTHVRVELFGGYKVSNRYYQQEQDACGKRGCTLEFRGPSVGVDAFVNIKGRPRGDDYFDVGLSVSFIPIVTAMRNNPGYDGELGPIPPGAGAMAYVPLRLTLRRPNFLYLFSSRYLVSSFGFGLAFPVASGAGTEFTGADGPKPTIGGRLGLQLPLGDRYEIGAASNWSVIWYGPSFYKPSYQAAYGLHFAAHL